MALRLSRQQKTHIFIPNNVRNVWFKDGAVYRGEYKRGLEDGQGYIRYPNGNTLDAEFEGGKIMGHGVFR